MNNLLAGNFFSVVGEIFTNPKYVSMIFSGLKMTVIVSVGAAILGLLLGTIVAMIKITPKTNKFMSVPRVICDVYITIIRGTPMALQLFLMAFVILTARGIPQEVVAIVAFGINSGAYVAENVRAGILSVEKGQMEAGRALGLNGSQTMMKIIIPQGMKNVVPAIGNELIALIKETSIVGMIGMYDLTQVSKILGSGQNLATYFAPTTVIALFYLAIVYIVTFLVKTIERRLRESDRN